MHHEPVWQVYKETSRVSARTPQNTFDLMDFTKIPSPYGIISLRMSSQEFQKTRIYVSLSVLIGEIGGLSSIYMAFFAIMNVTLNEWS